MSTDLLHVRHLRPDDAETVTTVFDGLSDHSRYLRFHVPMPRLPGPVRRSLLSLDGRDRIALVAELAAPDGPVPVGIARLGRTGPAQAELAIAVVDEWHGLGIGRRLLTELADLAGVSGYTVLHAYVLPENHRVLHLLDRVFPGAVRHWDGSVFQVDCPVGTSQGSSPRASVMVR